MIDSPAEIVRSYRMAADPKKQIKVLAELNACSVKEIRQVLVGEGVLPRETEIRIYESGERTVELKGTAKSA